MQGRLTPSRGRGIQFFPFDNWKREFEIGSKIGINEIEWIFDYDRYVDNPLWDATGIQLINRVEEETGVEVKSVCFDYFMRRPFFKAAKVEAAAIRKENIEFVKKIITGMKEIGAYILEIPFVDASSMKTTDEKNYVTEFLSEVLIIADDVDVLIGCETDMPVGTFRNFLDSVNHPRIRANYDSGNSSGLGYKHSDELLSLSEYVANVHIKDRVYQGTTVTLGSGSADFDQVFSSLKKIKYGGSIVLQAARGEDGNEVTNIKNQLSFVKTYCKEYGLE